MLTITKEVPVAGRYDAVVCGGGPAGWVAAAAAARCGCRTALIERFGFLGGAATAGLVMPISAFFHNGRRVVGGIPWEFVETMADCGAARVELPRGHISADPEFYKLIAQRMVRAAGADVYTNSYLSGAVREGRRITAVLIENKNGTEAVAGSCFIDATGDGDLCALAGAETRRSVCPQPLSMDFQLTGVDLTTPLLRDSIRHDGRSGPSMNREIHAYLEELYRQGRCPNFCGPWFNTLVRGDRITVNMTRSAASALDNRAFAQAEFQLREDIFALVELLRERYPEFREAVIAGTAVSAGVREGRHLAGVHTLTGRELLRGEDFPDSIARNAHPVDIHVPAAGVQMLEEMPRAGHIPYRALISPQLDNLLAAGRLIAADSRAHATIRIQGTAMATGQAAGTAAALCCAAGTAVHDLDTAELRRVLHAGGCML